VPVVPRHAVFMQPHVTLITRRTHIADLQGGHLFVLNALLVVREASSGLKIADSL